MYTQGRQISNKGFKIQYWESSGHFLHLFTHNSKDSSKTGLSVFFLMLVFCTGTSWNMCSGQNCIKTYGSLKPADKNNKSWTLPLIFLQLIKPIEAPPSMYRLDLSLNIPSTLYVKYFNGLYFYHWNWNCQCFIPFLCFPRKLRGFTLDDLNEWDFHDWNMS